MEFTKNSDDKKQYFISEDLLSILEHEYMEASGLLHKKPDDILATDANRIKDSLLASNGMGHMLLNIYTKIPEEMIHGNSIREFLWKSLTGTDCRRDTGKGRQGTPPESSRGKGKSKGTKFSIWNR